MFSYWNTFLESYPEIGVLLLFLVARIIFNLVRVVTKSYKKHAFEQSTTPLTDTLVEESIKLLVGAAAIAETKKDTEEIAALGRKLYAEGNLPARHRMGILISIGFIKGVEAAKKLTDESPLEVILKTQKDAEPYTPDNI